MEFKKLNLLFQQQMSEIDLLKEFLNSVDSTEEEVYINVNLYDLIQKKLSELQAAYSQ